MKKTLLAAAAGFLAFTGCALPTGSSETTVFNPKSVSPQPGSVVQTAGNATIVIAGYLQVAKDINYSMIFVRDDGAVFLESMHRSGQYSAWTDYRFRQDTGAESGGWYFAEFCRGHVVTKAVFIASPADFLRGSAAREPGALYVFRDFNWGVADTRIDITLNYPCR